MNVRLLAIPVLFMAVSSEAWGTDHVFCSGFEECTVAQCGNGQVEEFEACDDGNNIDGDGCSANCQSLEICGNLITDLAVGENCDDGGTASGDGCSSDCQPEYCGNDVIDAGEFCDDGNNISGDGCSALCLIVEVCTPGDTRSCGSPDELSACTGIETCSSRREWDFCTAPDPQEEICDGIDNDCDGTVDEPFMSGGTVTLTTPFYPGDFGLALNESCGAGNCAGGVVICGPDTMSLICSTDFLAGPESCGNGQDEDCDGEVDEEDCL